MASMPSTFVETAMRKSEVSFTSTFSGVSGFPNRVGAFTSSPSVDLDGKLWAVRLYPGGYDESAAGFMSCLLALESVGNARASFKISVLNQKGWKDHHYSSDGVKDFCKSSDLNLIHLWGENNFLPHNMLKNASNGICVEDKLIIRVSLTIYGEVEHVHKSAGNSLVSNIYSNNSIPGSPARSNSIIDDLRSAIANSALSDVTIICGENRLPAHKFILTLRSPVFRAMLTGELAEATANEVVITDFDVPVMKAFLSYIYTDQVPAADLEEHGELLLAVACKYEVPGLEALCENHLCATLTASNVVNVLFLSDLYSAKHLKQRALMFIARHAKEVVREEGFFQGLSMPLCQEVIMVLAGVSPEQQQQQQQEHEQQQAQGMTVTLESEYKTPERPRIRAADSSGSPLLRQGASSSRESALLVPVGSMHSMYGEATAQPTHH